LLDSLKVETAGLRLSGVPNIVYKHFIRLPQQGSDRSQALYLHVAVFEPTMSVRSRQQHKP